MPLWKKRQKKQLKRKVYHFEKRTRATKKRRKQKKVLCTGTCAQRCSAPTFLTAVSRPRRRRLGPRDPVNAWSKLSGATRSNGDTDRSTHAVHQHHGTRDENEHGHGNETKRNETKTIPRKENFHPYRDPPPLSLSLSLSLFALRSTRSNESMVPIDQRSTINDRRETERQSVGRFLEGSGGRRWDAAAEATARSIHRSNRVAVGGAAWSGPTLPTRSCD